MSSIPRHSVSVAGVVLDDIGRVLITRRRDNGQWQAPGGVLELHENFEDGVIREIREETGVDVTVDSLTGVYKNMSMGVVALVFKCRVVTGEASTSDEVAEVSWATVEEVVRVMTPAFAVRVTDAVDIRREHPASRAHDGTNLL